MINKKLTTFYIIRHGQTEFNVKQIVQGHIDSPLTDKGVEEIKKLAVRLRDVHFDLAFSSDLLRAQRTAEIIALEHKLEVQTTNLLRERNFGIYEGKQHEALDTYNVLLDKLNDQERFEYTADGVESDKSVIQRLMTFLRETAITHPGKTILTTTHGGMLRTLLIHLGYGTYETLRRGAVGNLGYSILETDGVDIFVKHVEGVTKKDE